LLYPVVAEGGMLAGVVRRAQLAEFCASEDVLDRNPVVCYPKEPLRVVVNRMVETGRTRLPVVENPNSRKLVGMISLNDLFQARVRNLDEERRRERVLRMRFPILSR